MTTPSHHPAPPPLLALSHAPAGWSLAQTDGGAPAIERRWRFARYAQVIAFVNAVAALAERDDHHPELRVRHGDCTVRYSTHDAGGLTARDLHAAEQVNALAAHAPGACP